MKQETFTKALIATARITCCASLFGLGCQEKDENTNPTTTDTGENSDEDPADTSTTEDTADTASSQDTGTSDTETGSDPVYDESCVELIADAFPDSSQWPDPQTVAQEVKDCCELAAQYYDMTALQEDGSFDWSVIDGWEYRDQCCTALEWQSDTLACTPCGPPMPPKYRALKIHRPQNLQRILVRHA